MIFTPHSFTKHLRKITRLTQWHNYWHKGEGTRLSPLNLKLYPLWPWNHCSATHLAQCAGSDWRNSNTVKNTLRSMCTMIMDFLCVVNFTYLMAFHLSFLILFPQRVFSVGMAGDKMLFYRRGCCRSLGPGAITNTQWNTNALFSQGIQRTHEANPVCLILWPPGPYF